MPSGFKMIARILTLTAMIAGLGILPAGCGSIPIRHVPKVEVSPANMSDLHGTQPVDLKAGECSSTEEEIGSVGMGKVVAKLSEWAQATVEGVKINLTARGATITAGSRKALNITMTKAELDTVASVPTCKIVLTATTPEGLNSTFEGSSSFHGPLAVIDKAVDDAVKKLLTDPAVDVYLRK